MWRCVLGRVVWRVLVVAGMMMWQLVLCHHVVAVGRRQCGVAEVQHGPAAAGAVR